MCPLLSYNCHKSKPNNTDMETYRVPSDNKRRVVRFQDEEGDIPMRVNTVTGKVRHCIQGYCMGLCGLGVCVCLAVGIVWLVHYLPRF